MKVFCLAVILVAGPSTLSLQKQPTASANPSKAIDIPSPAIPISLSISSASFPASYPGLGAITIKTDISVRNADKVTFAGVLSMTPEGGDEETILDAFTVTDAHVNDQRFGPRLIPAMRTNTNLAEAYAILLALQRWGQEGQDQAMICYTDNALAAEILQGCAKTLETPACGLQAMSDKGSEGYRLIVRVGMAIVDLSRRRGINVEIQYHSRTNNKIAHDLSRRGPSRVEYRVGLPVELSEKLLANDIWFSENSLRIDDSESATVA